jgi:hypothetical protein
MMAVCKCVGSWRCSCSFATAHPCKQWHECVYSTRHSCRCIPSSPDTGQQWHHNAPANTCRNWIWCFLASNSSGKHHSPTHTCCIWGCHSTSYGQ